MMAGVVTEDIDSKNDGKRVLIKVRIDREPIPIRDEILRALKVIGLKSRPVERDDLSMMFAKE
jgi:hypothetical protein